MITRNIRLTEEEEEEEEEEEKILSCYKLGITAAHPQLLAGEEEVQHVVGADGQRDTDQEHELQVQ